jgi:hypothetical protein
MNNVKMLTIDHSYGSASRPYIGSVEQFAGFEHLWKDCNDHHELPYNHVEGLEVPARMAH